MQCGYFTNRLAVVQLRMVHNGTIADTADTKPSQTATNSEGEATGSGVTAPVCLGRKFRSKIVCVFGYLGHLRPQECVVYIRIQL